MSAVCRNALQYCSSNVISSTAGHVTRSNVTPHREPPVKTQPVVSSRPPFWVFFITIGSIFNRNCVTQT